jgi:hypothetical protein
MLSTGFEAGLSFEPRRHSPTRPSAERTVSILSALLGHMHPHCTGVPIHNSQQIHNQSYLGKYLPFKSPDRGC